jgi:hypothetical protein
MLELHWRDVEDGWYKSRLGLGAVSRVAKRVGCSEQTVMALADGSVQPSIKQFRALREALRAVSA